MNNYLFWIWKNYLNEKQIKQFNKDISKKIIKKESVDSAAFGLNGTRKKQLDASSLFIKGISNWTDPILKEVHYINEKCFGYDLHNNFQHNDFCNYNVYSSKTKDHYKWHTDVSVEPTHDCKFTVLINLSEKKYTGGEFKIFNDDEKTIKDFSAPGSILMFKSHLNHCVTPVTKGERITLTIFVTGPVWR
jgi:predicted 2-oxoglutarate/Fe(II)-dependent dioxygenase YbiX|tara:strand:+ start:1640 stop:2209 length:570 start_codon:yes stop_codon:yes gene_type:complete